MPNIHRYTLMLVAAVLAFQAASRRSEASPYSDFYITQALDRYFPLPQDGRTLGMSGAGGLECGSSACLYLNPAGLGFLRTSELSAAVGYQRFTGNEYPSGDAIEQYEINGYGIGAFPVGRITRDRPRYGAFAVGLSRYQGHTDDAVNSTPDGHTRTLAFGYAPIESLSLGYAYSFFDDQLRTDLADLHSHARTLQSFGAQIRLPSEFTIGVAFRLGLGQSDTAIFGEDADELKGDGLSHPRQYAGAVGLSKRFSFGEAAVDFDYAHLKSRATLSNTTPETVFGGNEEGDVFNLRIGVEAHVSPALCVRTGFRWHEVAHYEFMRADLRELSGGIHGPGFAGGLGYTAWDDGKSVRRLRFDYGFEYMCSGNGELRHLLSMTAALG